jgi:Glycine zipper 2TM domain
VKMTMKTLGNGLGISRSVLVAVAVSGLCLVLASCADAPARPAPRQARAAPPPAQPAPPPVNTQVYVYPTSGQSADRQGRDRYECYLWSVKQTGFDPSQARLAPHQRVEVVPMPPQGTDTVAGAATGAILGAVISSPHNAAAGAVGGAIVGGALGAASDASRAAQAKQVQERYDRRNNGASAQVEEQASNYRRALTACLEGRGYTVK